MVSSSSLIVLCLQNKSNFLSSCVSMFVGITGSSWQPLATGASTASMSLCKHSAEECLQRQRHACCTNPTLVGTVIRHLTAASARLLTGLTTYDSVPSCHFPRTHIHAMYCDLQINIELSLRAK